MRGEGEYPCVCVSVCEALRCDKCVYMEHA